MARDIEVKTRLTAEEYVAMEALAEHEGMTHSGLLRHLLKVRMYAFAHELMMDAGHQIERPASGPKQARSGSVPLL
jgi:hypothetical protein